MIFSYVAEMWNYDNNPYLTLYKFHNAENMEWNYGIQSHKRN